MQKPTKTGQSPTPVVACKLTGAAFHQRQETVLAELRKHLISKSALARGYAYAFDASDDALSQLADFIRTERVCCSFFDFELQVPGDGSSIRLIMTGPQGTQEFLDQQMPWR